MTELAEPRARKSRADARTPEPAGREPAANTPAAPRSTADPSAAPTPTAAMHVRKIDPAARKTMLEAIRKRNAERGTTATTVGPRASAPTLPVEDNEQMKRYIRASVRELIPLLAECYQTGLEQNPKLAGKVVVEFTIEGDPEVGGVVGDSKVDPNESTLADAAVHECMQETMHALQIDPPAAGGVVNVRYPFEFRPAED